MKDETIEVIGSIKLIKEDKVGPINLIPCKNVVIARLVLIKATTNIQIQAFKLK